MNSFTIKGEADFVRINLEEVFGFPDETSHWGGYDVNASIEIKSGNFQVRSTFYTSTGELFEFYERIKKCNEVLKGFVLYENYEKNLSMKASYDDLGHLEISGTFSENDNFRNKLNFEFNSDQSFIRYTIEELELIATQYGGMNGQVII